MIVCAVCASMSVWSAAAKLALAVFAIALPPAGCVSESAALVMCRYLPVEIAVIECAPESSVHEISTDPYAVKSHSCDT